MTSRADRTSVNVMLMKGLLFPKYTVDYAPGPGDPMIPTNPSAAVTQHSRNTPQFYLTAPSPCPYLAGQEERRYSHTLSAERAAELNDLLTHGGFSPQPIDRLPAGL